MQSYKQILKSINQQESNYINDDYVIESVKEVINRAIEAYSYPQFLCNLR